MPIWFGVARTDYVLVYGARETRVTLARWNREGWRTVGVWAAGAAAVALVLLGAVLVVTALATPDPTPISLAGLTSPPEPGDVVSVLFRNSLVLALHAMACVAGFIAGSALPISAARRTGLWRWIHEKARPVALGWVIAVTCFSLTTQAYILGSEGATLAGQLRISPPILLLTVIPHALPELTALFLPLAAWTIASRRGEWSSLLAATVVTVAIAVPVLIAAATWEVYAWPRLLVWASPLG